MKGFFRWFKSSTKIKRWILIIIIGILIYAIKMKRLAIQEKHKSEISQLIINDFG